MLSKIAVVALHGLQTKYFSVMEKAIYFEHWKLGGGLKLSELLLPAGERQLLWGACRRVCPLWEPSWWTIHLEQNRRNFPLMSYAECFSSESDILFLSAVNLPTQILSKTFYLQNCTIIKSHSSLGLKSLLITLLQSLLLVAWCWGCSLWVAGRERTWPNLSDTAILFLIRAEILNNAGVSFVKHCWRLNLLI